MNGPPGTRDILAPHRAGVTNCPKISRPFRGRWDDSHHVALAAIGGRRLASDNLGFSRERRTMIEERGSGGGPAVGTPEPGGRRGLGAAGLVALALAIAVAAGVA